jgi:hypothetical protein
MARIDALQAELRDIHGRIDQVIIKRQEEKNP